MPWPIWMPRLQPRLNPAALRRAGRAGSLADLEHVGRRTGLTRHTPLRAFRRGDVVAVGVNFGQRSDWVRNVLAAGAARMALGGLCLELTEPRLLTLQEAGWVFPWWFRIGLRHLVRTEHCLVLTVAAESALSGA